MLQNVEHANQKYICINVFDAFFLLISCTRVNTEGMKMCHHGEVERKKGFLYLRVQRVTMAKTVHRSECVEADRPHTLATRSLPALRLFFKTNERK